MTLKSIRSHPSVYGNIHVFMIADNFIYIIINYISSNKITIRRHTLLGDLMTIS